jgi:UDP-N-acetyl-D-mannosaminuronic acid dehydrogenase
MHAFETISIIGLGYIGLPTAAIIAKQGIKVVGVDVNPQTVKTINKGQIHIVEPGLEAIVKNVVDSKLLTATLTPQAADAFLIAVPTPFKEGHEPDLDYIEAAAKAIAPVLNKGNLVILESTSPVGSTENLSQWLAKARPDLTFPHNHGEQSDIRVAYCPERVLPGRVIEELVSNDRVIGGLTDKCSSLAASLYKTFVSAECILTNARTAEMCKLTENSFRDVNIAFANELSILCNSLNIDVWELISLANRHPRVNILKPGPGVGGHCIAVDPWFIISANPENAKLIHAARLINDGKPDWVIQQIMDAVEAYTKKHPETRKNEIVIGCYGLAFKPDIDDLRESPAVEIVHRICEVHEGKVIVVEPHISTVPSILIDSVQLGTAADVFSQAHIIVYLVAHSSFRAQLFKSYTEKIIIDTCGLLKLKV